MEIKLCPDCKVPVQFQPDLNAVIGGPDRSTYDCPNCHERYDVNFSGFIKVKRKAVWFDRRLQCTICGTFLKHPGVDERYKILSLSEECPNCGGWERDPLKDWETDYKEEISYGLQPQC
jgi:hypothetical protein